MVTILSRKKGVSLKQAKELGVAIHGSQAAMETYVAAQNAGKIGHKLQDTIQWLTRPSPESPTRRPNGVSYDDQFCGSSYIRFPALRPNKSVENGIWCLGCERNVEKLDGPFHVRDIPLLDPGSFGILERMGDLARTKSEFIEHARVCTGVKELLEGRSGSDVIPSYLLYGEDEFGYIL